MISREIACVDPLIGPVWTFYEGVKVPPAGCFGSAGTGLDLARLPAEAAAATFTFAVTAPGEGDCPDNAAIRESVGRVMDVLENMKDCP